MSKEKTLKSAEKYEQGGKLDKALKEYLKVFQEDSLDMRVQLKIADLYMKKKDLPHATQNYQAVAEFYTKEKFHLKAIAVYKTILKLNPTDTVMNEKLGDLFRQVGLIEDAVNQYYIVAGYYDSKGMLSEATEIRRKIIEIDPANTTGRIRLAELLQSSGQTDESLHEYEEAAKILRNKNDRSGLIEVYEKILYYRPDNAEMLKELCEIYFERREYKKALARIEAAPDASKEHLRVLELWCEALLVEHQVDQARKRFRDLYRKALEENNAEVAAKTYSRILAEFSDDEEYLTDLSQFQKEVGLEHKKGEAKFREDFESTQMVDLRQYQKEMDEAKKRAEEKKVAEELQKKQAQEKKGAPKPAPKAAAPEPPKPATPKGREFEETRMINLNELEELQKKMKGSSDRAKK
jgi:tetratricopeptide (TPR) repeat protein